MKGTDGLTLARRLRAARPDAVIVFVTNFVQYAPEGYEDQHQHHRVSQHPVFGELAHQLRQGGQEGCADDGAGQGAGATDDDLAEQLSGVVEAEVGGDHGGHVVGVDPAADAGEEGGNRKGQHFIKGNVDAGSLGGDVVFPDGLDGAAKRLRTNRNITVTQTTMIQKVRPRSR